MLLLLHARHPQALVERGPTSGISQNSTTSASQALCPSLSSEQSPHASHLRSSLPRLARPAPDRAHTSRASQACLQRCRIGAAVLDLMCGSYLSTNSSQARNPSADPAFTTVPHWFLQSTASPRAASRPSVWMHKGRVTAKDN